MKSYIKFIDTLNIGIKYIVSTLFMIMVTLVFLQVLTRFVIDYPISWSEEISRYLMIYIVLLGSSLLVRKNGHIAIDFLLEVVNPEVKKRLDLIILFISMIFFTILIFYGTELTLLVVTQSTPTLQFSMAWAYAAIPLGALLMILNAFAVLFETIILGRNEREEQVL